jgi:hypothetical protein
MFVMKHLNLLYEFEIINELSKRFDDRMYYRCISDYGMEMDQFAVLDHNKQDVLVKLGQEIDGDPI